MGKSQESGSSIPMEVSVYYSHYLKLLELFETRQTWAFNFGLIVYGAAFSAIGPIFGQQSVPLPPGDGAVLRIIVFSFALPILILATFCLYADVSIYCAALNVANTKYHRGIHVGFQDPGELAVDWLNGRPAGNDWPAKMRMLLFAFAPAVGVLVSAVSCAGIGRAPAGDMVTSVVALCGVGTSLTTGILTAILWRRVERARKDAKTVAQGAPVTPR